MLAHKLAMWQIFKPLLVLLGIALLIWAVAFLLIWHGLGP